MEKKVSNILPFRDRTVFLARGRGELGEVPDTVAGALCCPSGPIRILNGFHGADGKGYGLAHIEAHSHRMSAIAGLGFADAMGFVQFIASNYSKAATQENGRVLLLAERGSHWCHLVAQWNERGFWSVTTAIPKRHHRGLKIVWEKARPDESEPSSGGVGARLRFATLSLPKTPKVPTGNGS
jgi:hypothetical protein